MRINKIFPTLVSQNAKGYKEVNYGLELQLLTLEALKELKLENDSLKKRLETLEHKALERKIR